MKPIEISKSTVLVVEGKEEQFFFEALIDYLGIHSLQILPIGGKEKLRANLMALTRSPGFSAVVSLGIVRDADANPDAAFQSVRGALQSVDLPVPERPLTSAGDRPQVTVIILPEENTVGMLEDLCLMAVQGDPATDCVDQYFHCIEQRGLSLPNNMSKAKVQAYLASRLEAGKRLGEAAQAGYWPWGDDAFGRLRNILQQVSSL